MKDPRDQDHTDRDSLFDVNNIVDVPKCYQSGEPLRPQIRRGTDVVARFHPPQNIFQIVPHIIIYLDTKAPL